MLGPPVCLGVFQGWQVTPEAPSGAKCAHSSVRNTFSFWCIHYPAGGSYCLFPCETIRG